MSIDHTPRPRMTARTPSKVPEQISGIPIMVDMQDTRVCVSEGMWWFKRITLGRNFFLLPFGMQMAALLHEVGHCLKRHHEERFWAMLGAHFRDPRGVARWMFCSDEEEQERLFHEFLARHGLKDLAYRHEFEADDYAKKQGYGGFLAEFLTLHAGGEVTLLHPSSLERLHRLAQA